MRHLGSPTCRQDIPSWEMCSTRGHSSFHISDAYAQARQITCSGKSTNGYVGIISEDDLWRRKCWDRANTNTGRVIRKMLQRLSTFEKCQRQAKLQHKPSAPLSPILSPWTFAQCGMDMIPSCHRSEKVSNSGNWLLYQVGRSREDHG